MLCRRDYFNCLSPLRRAEGESLTFPPLLASTLVASEDIDTQGVGLCYYCSVLGLGENQARCCQQCRYDSIGLKTWNRNTWLVVVWELRELQPGSVFLNPAEGWSVYMIFVTFKPYPIPKALIHLFTKSQRVLITFELCKHFMAEGPV